MARTLPALAINLCVALLAAGLAHGSEVWPQLSEISETFHINTTDDAILVKMPLADVMGKQQYLLACQGGSEEHLDKLNEQSGDNFVGPFACRLASATLESDDWLLSEDESAPWYSRGQLHSYHDIVGACGRYPEYGAIRNFRLRGFRLQLRFVPTTIYRDGTPTTFDLDVSVKNDPTVRSSQAEQTGYLTPYKVGTSCDKVVIGNERRMCRDAHLSWVECDKIGR